MSQTIEMPSRVVLKGVPKIHFYEGGPRCPEDICGPSAIRAVMEYLGENIGCDHCQPKGRKWGLRCSYSYFMGVMGVAWQIAWVPGWQHASFAPEYLPGTIDEPYRRAFNAVGYEIEYFTQDAGEDVLLSKIIDTISEKGRPAIAIGIAGPPEPAVLTGYDENGDILIGWSFFQDFPPFNEGIEYEEGHDHYFRIRGGTKQLLGLLIIGEHGEKPEQEKVFQDSLRLGLEIMRSNEVKGVPAGAAAYDAWADALLKDDDFNGKDEARLRELHDVHNMGVGQVAEYRWYGSVWLANTYGKAHYDAHEELLKASGCFAAEHALMWKLWSLAGGIANPDAWKLFADPSVRRQMAPVILASRDKYIEGAQYIEKALSQLK